MTGQEHYAEAEKLLQSAARIRSTSDDAGQTLAAAQAHATLALVDAVRRRPQVDLAKEIGHALTEATRAGARRAARS